MGKSYHEKGPLAAGLPSAIVPPQGRVRDVRCALGSSPVLSSELRSSVSRHFTPGLRVVRRLHKRPNAYEIDRCKWWLDHERAIVQPKTIVALGATAARSLLGRVITITKVRGQALVLDDGTAAFVTIHPSALLRIQDRAERQQQFLAFVADLRKIAKSMKAKG